MLVAALLCAVASVASWFFYFALYWPYRDRFDKAGRYVDETSLVVYHEQSGLLAMLAVALSALTVALVLFWRFCRPKRGTSQCE